MGCGDSAPLTIVAAVRHRINVTHMLTRIAQIFILIAPYDFRVTPPFSKKDSNVQVLFSRVVYMSN